MTRGPKSLWCDLLKLRPEGIRVGEIRRRILGLHDHEILSSFCQLANPKSNDKEWTTLNGALHSVNWDNILDKVSASNKTSIDIAANEIIQTLENKVNDIMKRKICAKTTKNANGTKFKSSNLIP